MEIVSRELESLPSRRSKPDKRANGKSSNQGVRDLEYYLPVGKIQKGSKC